MIDLNTVIAPRPDFKLTFAVAINDRGMIAGFGVPSGCAPKDVEACGNAYVLIPCTDACETEDGHQIFFPKSVPSDRPRQMNELLKEFRFRMQRSTGEHR